MPIAAAGSSLVLSLSHDDRFRHSRGPQLLDLRDPTMSKPQPQKKLLGVEFTLDTIHRTAR